MITIAEEIKSLISQLNDATRAYDEGKPYISDVEWDQMYNRLKELEHESGIIFPNSPTQSINYQVVNKLNKVEHNHKMLSLDKTKSLGEVASFLGDHAYVSMLKMDGLTCSLHYVNGHLVSAETRGNGLVGEDVLHNALVVGSIPQFIDTSFEDIVIDGEIICTKKNFEKFSSEYKNPRNFAAGSIRLLDASECATRDLDFVAWDLITQLVDPFNEELMFEAKLDYLRSLGFTVVPYVFGRGDLQEQVNTLVEMAETWAYPIDGVVFKFNDCAFGRSLGETSHHFNNALAYKFYDEESETTLLDIEWQIGRTGKITPVAIFETIDIDGSAVSRASLHNQSVLYEILGTPYVGEPIRVIKSNMIIPQIVWANKNFPKDEEVEFIPSPAGCPICGGRLTIHCDNGSEVLMCDSADCPGKFINVLDHFCSKKGLDIKGLSKSTLTKLADWGWLDSISDIFRLQEHREEWVRQPGFGAKSVDNALAAIEASRHCDVGAFICALGIPLIGATAAKALANYYGSWSNFVEAIENGADFSDLPNFGYEMNKAIHSFDFIEAKEIADKYIIFNTVTNSTEEKSNLAGLTFVVTGKVNKFKNRDELKSVIESLGGKVTGSVSKNTTYLLNNNVTSTSTKNKQAQALGIPILSEEDFIKMFMSDT